MKCEFKMVVLILEWS